MRKQRMYRGKVKTLSILLGSLLVLGAVGCNGDDDDDPARDAGDTGDADMRDVDVDADADNGIDGPSARLQVINEAPDPNIDSVQVSVDGTSFTDELAFRSATAFEEVEADTTITIEVSAGADEFERSLELDEDDEVIAVIHGVSEPDQVPLASQERDASFGIEVLEDARTEPAGGADEAVAFHSSPDLPTVDLIAERADTMVEELDYAEFSDYVELPEGVAPIDIVNSGDQRRLDSFQTPDLDGGEVFTLVASGFLDVEESDRPELAMMAYPPEGGPGISFDQAARLQVVHNSADPDVGPVDVVVDNETIAEGVDFREATRFVTFVSETALEVELIPADNGDEPIFEDTIQLAEGGSFIGVASGVLDPQAFVANPEDEDIGFDLHVNVTREMAVDGEQVSLRAFHGITDAPTVDLLAVDADDEVLADELSYGEFSDLLSLDPVQLQLQVVTSADDTLVGTTSVDLSNNAAQAFNLVASGFLDTQDNPTGDLDADAAILLVDQQGEVTVLDLAS